MSFLEIGKSQADNYKNKKEQYHQLIVNSFPSPWLQLVKYTGLSGTTHNGNKTKKHWTGSVHNPFQDNGKAVLMDRIKTKIYLIPRQNNLIS
jgi:hypothetical protein